MYVYICIGIGILCICICIGICICICIWLYMYMCVGVGCPCKFELIREHLSFSIPKAPNTISHGINMHNCNSVFGINVWVHILHDGFVPQNKGHLYIKLYLFHVMQWKKPAELILMTFTSSNVQYPPTSMSIVRGSLSWNTTELLQSKCHPSHGFKPLTFQKTSFQDVT